MIMSKAPFRISFIGGGSDFRSFYSRGPGAVVSTTIDKYMYIMIHPYFHDKIRIKYSKLEDVDNVEEVQHPLVRECFKLVRINKGIEIASIADVPAGTGLGSSSTFTVSLLHGLYTHKREFVTKERLAKEACRIEIDTLGEPIGKQDQYAASYGGFNYIQFNPDETVFVEPLICKPEVRKKLEENLLLFYVGNEREARQILNEEKANIEQKDKRKNIEKMVELAKELRDSLKKNLVKEVGEILHQGWLLKKTLASNISNPILDEYYEKAQKAGASGGKILGAGGGGFFLFYCEPKYQDKLRKTLKLRELRFCFENEGSKIIYTDNYW